MHTYKAEVRILQSFSEARPFLAPQFGSVWTERERCNLETRIAKRSNPTARFGERQVLKELIADSKTRWNTHSTLVSGIAILQERRNPRLEFRLHLHYPRSIKACYLPACAARS